jgi:multidrug transporter EmrE-like cation transporter
MMVNVALFSLYVVVSSFGLYKLKSASGLFSLDFFVGFTFYGLGFLLFYSVLTRLPLSIVFPIAAGGLVVATQIVGYTFLGESIRAVHAGGIVLILIGIVLIFARV